MRHHQVLRLSAAVLLILLFLGGLLGKGIVMTAVETNSSSAGSFDFKREIFGNLSSISVSVVSVNNSTGEVTLNGVDTREPTVPFSWDWDDGNVSEDFFPQTHIYFNKTRNYVVTVTSHYPDGKTDSAEALVRFVPPAITPIPLPSNIAVSIPNYTVNLISRMPGYGIPANLTYFGDEYFALENRSLVEYVLTAAASIQEDFVNDNVFLIDGGFRQVLLRDPTSAEMYALWYTSPVSIGAGNYTFQGSVQWSSVFHEMGHDVTLNSPANYYYGGKIDGNANAIFSETMAQIFQHATAYELINNAGTYGLSKDIVFEIEQSAIQSMWIVRRAYEDYINAGMKFCSWNSARATVTPLPSPSPLPSPTPVPSPSPSPSKYNPGVLIGQYVKYNYVYVGPPLPITIDWLEMEVTAISGKEVTLRRSGQLSNGTAIPGSGDSSMYNVETGMMNGTMAYALGTPIIAADLNEGDAIPPSDMGYKINKTETKTYLGVSRAVNIIETTYSDANYDNHWILTYDKASGMQLEMEFEWTNKTATPPTTIKAGYSAIETNIFAAPTPPISGAAYPIEWIVAIVAAIVVVIVIVALILRRRK